MIALVFAVAGISSWPWPTLAAAAGFVASMATFARWTRNRSKQAVAKLRLYLDERSSEVAAAISDPIVTEVSKLRSKVGELGRQQREHTAECRIDRDAIWHHLGGRPGEASPGIPTESAIARGAQ
jgi:hypothetical protein